MIYTSWQWSCIIPSKKAKYIYDNPSISNALKYLQYQCNNIKLFISYKYSVRLAIPVFHNFSSILQVPNTGGKCKFITNCHIPVFALSCFLLVRPSLFILKKWTNIYQYNFLSQELNVVCCVGRVEIQIEI